MCFLIQVYIMMKMIEIIINKLTGGGACLTFYVSLEETNTADIIEIESKFKIMNNQLEYVCTLKK